MYGLIGKMNGIPGRREALISMPSVQQAIAKGKPLIASFGDYVATEPVGGHGL